MRRLCFCLYCPHCQRERGVRHKHAISGPLGDWWWIQCYCTACGSWWASWHLLERLFGITWRRVYAINPGKQDDATLRHFVAMARQYAHSQPGRDGADTLAGVGSEGEQA